jgi:2-polyprenyl-6-methoxyphenol hydroxylase-like FAD-dependent oxidoreductase
VAHEGRAFERFTEYGPLAMLPMSQGRSSLVWCHPLEKADEQRASIKTRLVGYFGLASLFLYS